MKNQKLRKKVIAYNKTIAAKKDKANDLDIIVAQIMTLPYGQIKKVLTDEVVTVLEKYGYKE